MTWCINILIIINIVKVIILLLSNLSYLGSWFNNQDSIIKNARASACNDSLIFLLNIGMPSKLLKALGPFIISSITTVYHNMESVHSTPILHGYSVTLSHFAKRGSARKCMYHIIL